MGDLAVLRAVTPEMARELAIGAKVCVRPLMRRVLDRDTGVEERVAIPCGSTRETVCPSCAHKARVLRMQQCAEGWHRTDDPHAGGGSDPGDTGGITADEPDSSDLEDSGGGGDTGGITRRTRSTRRRSDAAELPRVPARDTTVGKVFTASGGREYRPSMFLTLTLPGYGPIKNGVPVDPGTYDYRRAALDALHFSKLVDRFWQNLRRCAGYKVQYFAAVEPQARLTPHLHAAIRGAVPRSVLRQVVRATYVQVWWPAHDIPVYTDRDAYPVWDGEHYCDPSSGVALPSWDEAVDAAIEDPESQPAHVMHFGSQLDMRGIIAPSAEADRAVRYLTKYLTKAIADPLDSEGAGGVARERHVSRLAAELRFLPCSPRCANWLRYGVQPDKPGPGLVPGRCVAKAHDRENLGVGGRRVLVSRQWSGKTLAQHRADRGAVVREALLSAGILAPEIERMAADVTTTDGRPRFVWTDTKTDPAIYARVIMESIAERDRWRAQYERAKSRRPVDSHSATGPSP